MRYSQKGTIEQGWAGPNHTWKHQMTHQINPTK